MENNTTTLFAGDSWNPPYHPIIQTIGWIVATILSLETILGNSMVLLAYRLERSISKQLNNRFIVSLAMSDLIIGIEGIPFFTIYVINGDRWPLGSIACETWLFLDYTLCLVSILTVLLITADRYLSVCYTASYLKWQTPFKVQMLIFISWLFPAMMFGLMIYGWPWIGERDEEIRATSNGECYAPFLSNPFVNMSMYLAYYWTTLIAMLILYKGIHKAAKKLEKRSRAREHRHIALLLTQRLGTQVGVGLMLHARKYHEEVMKTKQQPDIKDSGYATNNTLSTESGDRRRSSFAMLVKAVQSTQKLTKFRGRGTTFAFRTNSADETGGTPSLMSGSHHSRQMGGGPPHMQTTGQFLERLSEQNSQVGADAIGGDEIAERSETTIAEQRCRSLQAVDVEQKSSKECEQINADESSSISQYDVDDDELPRNMNAHQLDSDALASLSTEIFHDDSLSSVLHFNQSAMASPILDMNLFGSSSSELTMRGGIGNSNGTGVKKRRFFSLTSPQTATGTRLFTGSLKERSRCHLAEISSLPQQVDQSVQENSTAKLPEEMEEERKCCDVDTLEILCPTKNDHHQLQQNVTMSMPKSQTLTPSFESHFGQQSLKPPESTVQSTESQRRSSASSSHHSSGERRPSSRKSSQNEASSQKHQATGPKSSTGNQLTMLERWRQRLAHVFQAGIGLDSRESSTNMPATIRDPLAPGGMHNSRSFSSMSSISSSTQPGYFSKRTSVLLPGQQQQQIQIPTLTITRDSLVQSVQTFGGVATNIITTGKNEAKDSPQLQPKAGDSRRSSNSILQALFAPISTFQRRRKKTKAERRAHKAFRTITFIVGLFAILWSPYYVVATLYGFCRSDCIPSILYNISYYMCYLNSSLNPFAYALANRQFRSAFSRILRGNFRQSN